MTGEQKDQSTTYKFVKKNRSQTRSRGGRKSRSREAAQRARTREYPESVRKHELSVFSVYEERKRVLISSQALERTAILSLQSYLQ